jgi:predicted ATP-dependent serine protease
MRLNGFVINMVKEFTYNGETVYVCEKCGLKYRERIWAEKCEEFCTKYNACSIEITKHAIK